MVPFGLLIEGRHGAGLYLHLLSYDIETYSYLTSKRTNKGNIYFVHNLQMEICLFFDCIFV